MSLRKYASFLGGVVLLYSALTGPAFAADTAVAATAVNALGVDLLSRVAKPNENALISPYSIQSALAMTYAGAAGGTKAEMARVLHYPKNEGKLHGSFAAFRRELDKIHERTAEIVRKAADAEKDGPSEPLTIDVANRLYGQSDYTFLPEFLSLAKNEYGAPVQQVDFRNSPEAARGEINRWVATSTHERITDLIPQGGVSETTRLVLANALYFKAPWAEEFSVYATKAEPFFVGGAKKEKVQTMQKLIDRAGYMRNRGGFCALSLGYVGHEVQLLILLPDKKDGLAALEAKLTPQLLAECAELESEEVFLHLPKFKLQPSTVSLGLLLQSLGMQKAFDQPPGSADFERMAPRVMNEYLYLSAVFHKTFLALDEKGTEAAAAAAVSMLEGFSVTANPPKPIEVKVDHPFLFAIQHRASGACLFLGRVVDPR